MIYYLPALLLLGILVLALYLWPFRVLWPVFWILTRLIYRIRVHGRENLPATGGALLVCNHVSYVDWLLLMVAQRRYIRFVIFAAWTRHWGLRHLLKWARVIPIDAWSGPRAIVKSLRLASDALAAGDLVCIFAEGRFTRTGFLLPFHRGFEQIVKHHPAPIIPVCLDQVWGSIFSFEGGRTLWKWPHELPYPVSIAFGPPMPPTSTAAEVRLGIQKLSADCAVDRAATALPVHRQFVRMAARRPFRVAMVDTLALGKPRHLNYGKVLTGAICLARRLRPLVGDEPMVGVWLPSSVGGAVTNIALALLGKTSVNLNYSASDDAVQSAIRQCSIRHVLTSQHFLKARPLTMESGVELVELETLRGQIGKREQLLTYLSVILLPGFVLERWVLGLGDHRPDDLATIIFSSGSTGEPKGVMLTHRNITANARSMIQAISLQVHDRVLGVLPFFHSFGYTVTLWAPLQIGASVVYHPDPRQAKRIGELCRTQHCTIFLTTSTFLGFYLRQCQPDDFKSLRILMCGAEKLQQSVAKEFEKKFGILPLEGYGCTELSPAAAANVPDQTMEGFKQIGNRPGTIGQPLPGVAACIVDPETFEPRKPGKEGLLLIYGPNVMKGYLGREDLTRQVVRDGWYVTGDMGRIDEDGFITLTGRLSRFAKIGGEMIPLEKVEEHLLGVLQAQERLCVVTSVNDESRGERLVVLYTSLNGLEIRAITQQLRAAGLSNLEVPGERDFVQVPELPILGSGKVHLQRVKELAQELMHASVR